MKMNHDKKLGRGLSVLLGESNSQREMNKNETATNNIVRSISVNNIVAGLYQPRKHFDQTHLAELSNSIRENGIIQPIIVRKATEQGTFEIIAGERRFKATKMAGLTQIPVIIKDIDNIQALEFAIIENVQRKDLSPIEEAGGYKQLMTEFEYTQDQVSKKIGCSRSHIANILRLLSLPKEVQEMLDNGKISFGHAKAIMNLENITEIAHQIVENNWSVRDVETMFKIPRIQPEAKTNSSKKVSASSKEGKTQPVKKIDEKLKRLFPENIVKSEYNSQKGKGKITIFFNNLKEIEELVDSF
ncbi:MAG: ParB family chromosome partitioning protein [Rickettsiales bacterium]|jgi:ParB family chromosome partitioning protein